MIPGPLLLGLLVLVLAEQDPDRLPGDASTVSLWTLPILLALPAWSVRMLGARALRRTWTGDSIHPIASRVTGLSVPLLYGLWLTLGDGLDLADSVGRAGETARVAMLLLPLGVAELARAAAVDEAHRRFVLRSLMPPFSPRPFGRRLIVLSVLGLVGLHVGFDLAEQSIWLHAAVVHTQVGSTLGTLAILTVVVLLLPWVAAWFLPTLSLTNSALGRRLLLATEGLVPKIGRLHLISTQGRILNAALVGATRKNQRLFVTDALVAALRPTALRGVLAHELGHGRRRHVGLLLIVAALGPALWIAPGPELLASAGTAVWIAIGIAAIPGVWLFRSVMHRFEHEADIESARLLGDPGGVVEALETVLRMHDDRDQASLRHPSVGRRIGVVLRWQADAEFRSLFEKRGRQLRTLLFALTAATTLGAGWVHFRGFTSDRYEFAIGTGDFGRALDVLDQVGGEALGLRDEEAGRRELRMARELNPVPWSSPSERLGFADAARDRGRRSLEQGSIDEATTWLGLANYYAWIPPAERTALLIGESIGDQDSETARTALEHLRSLRDVPSSWILQAERAIGALSTD